MGRPEPCVLFSQTFVHPQLDEYVDEVLFAESVVVTSCEFLEQNATSACSAVKLNGATSPPSFAIEVFVQCGGETRFRRICPPFLYSHSSSNILEIETVVTNHLVIRGSYKSLSMVLYGHTAEDLGQFNIEVDLDSSLTNTVSIIEGKLEDLPLALQTTNLTIEESIFPLKTLLPVAVSLDLPFETKQFIQLIFKVLDLPNLGNELDSVLSCIFSTCSIYATPNARLIDSKEDHVFIEAKTKLLQLYEKIEFDIESDIASTKQLMNSLSSFFKFIGNENIEKIGHPQIPQSKNVMLWMSIALLLCSSKESCFQFVDGGGMEQLGYAFNSVVQKSDALRLMTLGIIEKATRHSLGCEGFLGWWPREDENVPTGISDRYNQLLKLLMQNQRHAIASLTTYILHRVRAYEVASRYESSVLSILEGLSANGEVTSVTLDRLGDATLQLKKLLKLINLCGPIEDPSLIARSLVLGEAGLLSYKGTNGLIGKSDCTFRSHDVDPHFLSLLKERGFLPLSAALLSSSKLRSETGPTIDLFVGLASQIEAILFTLLFSRSGLIFLLHDPEVSSTIIRALRGNDDQKKEESPSLRYASVLISKGLFCRPQDVAMIVEMHLKVMNAIDNLNLSTPDTEEFLWLLWDLCRLSRSDCGKQALLALMHFPEALAVLMGALHSARELDPVSVNNGALPLNLAIFHAAAEIFEVIVTDSTASSLKSWIGHAKELHRALRSTSSPGSNKKDAPARLLEWIDAGVVYHRNGVLGLLRYACVLASGGDAHMASTSILASDTVDGDNVVGDGNIIDNLLGKHITAKDFPGVILRDSSVIQLTTAFRILAFISDTPAIAAALYDEGAVMVIHAVIINCRLMLERSSSIYDYLVDEGTECNSTSELLMERNREQSLVDLLIPALTLLINLLQKLQEAKEQHRNTKLMSALLQLHREVSPKLAACASDLTCPYPNFALGFESVCHLIASALACWPVYGWTPGLFHFLIDSLHATSLLALGPKEISSLFCLLIDLMPDEGVWLWKHGMPVLSVLRSLSVGTILGPQKERQVNWYLQSNYPEKLLTQLTPQLGNIAQIVFHCAISTSVVIQDMVRILIVRIARINTNNASVLIQPIIFWIRDRISGHSSLSDEDNYKIYRLLDFLALLLEHPHAKALLLNDSGIQMFSEVLERCIGAANSAKKQFSENYGVSLISCSIPVLKSISLISDGRTSSKHSTRHDRHNRENLSAEECFFFLSEILQLCTVLPVGKELVASLSAFKELASCNGGQSAMLTIPSRSHNNGPLRECWNNLLRSITLRDTSPVYVYEAMGTLSSGSLRFCFQGESLNVERVSVIKYLFGHVNDQFFEEGMKVLHELITYYDDTYMSPFTLSEIKESATLLLDLLCKPIEEVKVNDVITKIVLSSGAASKIQIITDRSTERIDDCEVGGFIDKFLWDCPENLHDRLPLKRKMSSLEVAPNRRARGDNNNTSAETISRSSVPPPTPSAGPTRRDNFRNRKPNTSRPPSMHVDDYVARERNTDVISIPRLGSSGRPPSIHVDEFMARQRERQNPTGTVCPDLKTVPSESKTDSEQNKSRPLKPDLDDDLQGIDIVFDAEESEPDDKLPFPQPDDLVMEVNSPRSIVEETESDVSRLGTPSASNMDENTPEYTLTRELSISSGKKLPDLADLKSFSTDTVATNYGKISGPSHNYYHKSSQSSYQSQSQSIQPVQPPLPPMPPPSTARQSSSIDMQSNMPPGFHVQGEYLSSRSGGGSTRQAPPPYSGSSHKYSSSSQSLATNDLYQQPPIMAPVQHYNRANSSNSLYANTSSSPHRGENMQQNLQINVTSMHSMQTLQPLQPPQISRPPPQPHHHLRAVVSASPQPEQGMYNMNMQQQPLQGQVSQAMYYQQQIEHSQTQQLVLTQPQPQPQLQLQPPRDGGSSQSLSQSQQDSGMSLHEYFRSPEAIQALLSDREKLCELLEQHPKLMQMLQDRLRQL